MKEHELLFGSCDDLLIGLQLTHSGRFSRPDPDHKLKPVIAYRHPYLDQKFGISNDHPLISDDEIHLRSEIYTPDIVIVQDESLMEIVDVLKGLKKNGKILINTTKKPEEFDFSKKYKVATVDATGVALKHKILVGGIPVVNTPVLGAVPKILDKVTLKSIQSVIKGKWKGEQGETNVKATKDAFDLVEVNF